jgi:hypothetical protein
VWPVYEKSCITFIRVVHKIGVAIVPEELSYVWLYFNYILFIILLKMSVLYIYIYVLFSIFSTALLLSNKWKKFK